jgi:RNase P/RNase MRP subunit POP5
MKLKNPPTARSKKRYVVFRLHSEERVDFYSMKNAVWNSLHNWMGEDGLGKANIRIIKNLYDQKGGTGFIQCDPRSVDHVKMGLSLVHQIGDQRVAFQTIRVTGTIKSGKSKAR